MFKKNKINNTASETTKEKTNEYRIYSQRRVVKFIIALLILMSVFTMFAGCGGNKDKQPTAEEVADGYNAETPEEKAARLAMEEAKEKADLNTEEALKDFPLSDPEELEIPVGLSANETADVFLESFMSCYKDFNSDEIYAMWTQYKEDFPYEDELSQSMWVEDNILPIIENQYINNIFSDEFIQSDKAQDKYIKALEAGVWGYLMLRDQGYDYDNQFSRTSEATITENSDGTLTLTFASNQTFDSISNPGEISDTDTTTTIKLVKQISEETGNEIYIVQDIQIIEQVE